MDEFQPLEVVSAQMTPVYMPGSVEAGEPTLMHHTATINNDPNTEGRGRSMAEALGNALINALNQHTAAQMEPLHAKIQRGF